MVLMKMGIKAIVLAAAVLMLVSGLSSVAVAADNMYAIASGSNSTANAGHGWNVSYAGDVNGDGNPDVIVGAPGENKAYIYLGPISSMTPAGADVTLSGVASSEFGTSVDWAKDLNGDHYDDVIVGAPGEDHAYVFLGGGTMNNVADITFVGQASSRFGASVCGLGDFTTDGAYNDIAIGAPLEDPATGTDAGAVYIFSSPYRYSQDVGTTIGYAAANWNLSGSGAGDQFGFSLASGTVDADLFPDLVIGAPFFNIPNSPTPIRDAGAVYYIVAKPIFPAGTTPNPMVADASDLKIYGVNSHNRFGWSVSNTSSIAGMPGDEILVGAPWSGSGGEVYVFTDSTIGSAGATINLSAGGTYDNVIMAPTSGIQFGYDVSWAGNMDGHGTSDIIVGSPLAEGNGSAYVFYTPLSATNVDGATYDAKFVGENAGERCGYSVSGALKASSLNTNMVVIGAPYQGSQAGGAYLCQVNMAPDITFNTNPAAPSIGNTSTTVTVTATYADNEGDAPATSLLHVFNEDASGAEIASSPFTMTAVSGTPDYKAGHDFQYSGTFPHGTLSLQFEFAATSGDTGTVLSPMQLGKLSIDGVAPQKVGLYNSTGVLNETSYDYAIELHFTWPADDGNDTGTGKVTYLDLKWSNTTSLDIGSWDSGKLIESNIEEYQSGTATFLPLQISQWFMTQPPGDPGTEEVIVVKNLNMDDTYHFAVMARDDQWNWAPISDPLAVRPYQLPDYIAPLPISYVDASDVPDDDGGVISLTWDATTDIKFSHYNIYVSDTEFTSVAGMSPTTTIDDIEDTSMNVTGLTNGNYYYFAVTAVDLAGNENRTSVLVSGPVRCLDNHAPTPPMVTGVTAEDNPADKESMIVNWTPVDISDFDHYKIYVSSSPFTTLTPGLFETAVADKTTGTAIINTSGGTVLQEGTAYYFAVTVISTNDIENTTVDPEMWAGPAYSKDNTDTSTPQLVTGVSASDRASDGGGAITVGWDVTSEYKFGYYNVYLSTDPIESDVTLVGDMTLAKKVAHKTATSTVVDELDGSPLVDGQVYWGVVALESWNGRINPAVTDDNQFRIEPVNNSDITPPSRVAGFSLGDVSKFYFNVSWTPFTNATLRDFNHYIVNYWTSDNVDAPIEILVDDIATGSWKINVVYQGKEYFVNMTVADDNGNTAAYTTTLDLTTLTADVAPFDLAITVDPSTSTIAKNTPIAFTGIASDDSKNATELSYFWDFDASDGLWWENSTSISPDADQGAIGPNCGHTYTSERKFTVTLKVSDGKMESTTTTVVSITGGGSDGGDGSAGNSYTIYIIIFAIVAILFVGVIIGAIIFFFIKKKPEETPEEGEGEGVMQEGVPQQPLDAASQETAAVPTEPAQQAPQYAAGPDGVVDPYATQAAPVDPMAGQAAPMDTMAGQPAPMDTMAGQPAPMDPMAGQAAPMDPMAGQPAPMDPMAGQPAPMDTMAGQAPQQTPAEDEDLFGPI